MKDKHTLTEVDGNAFAIMAYVRRALIESGHLDKVSEYLEKTKSSSYENLVAESLKYIDISNRD